MKKKFKLILQLVKKESTEFGAISIKESSRILKTFGNLAKKLNFDCYVKGEKKEILNYKPTGERYELKTLEDVALKISPDQFEMFIEDFRSFCNLKRNINCLKEIFNKEKNNDKNKNNGFIWIDSGLNEAKIIFEIEGSNKL